MYEWTLSNGLPVIAVPDRSKVVAMVIAFASGGRADPVRKCGLRHSGEHFLVGPTKITPDKVTFARRHERFCRELNAETDETNIVIYAVTDGYRIRSLIRFMAELVRSPLMSNQQFAEEIERVREEIGEFRDDPAAMLDLEFNAIMFKGSDLARGSLGTYDGLERITLDDLRSLYRRLLKANNMVISLAGRCTSATIKTELELAFGDLPIGRLTSYEPIDYRCLRGRIVVSHRPLEKVQAVIGWPTFGFDHRDRIALSVLRNHLSARESSPVRARLDTVGKGYATRDHLWHWPDVGQYCLSLSQFRSKLLDSLQVIVEETERLKDGLIPAEDLDLAISNLLLEGKGRASDALTTAKFFARQKINLGRVIPWSEYQRAVRSVTRQHVRRVAKTIFVRRRMSVVLQGRLQGLPRRKLLKSLGLHRS